MASRLEEQLKRLPAKPGVYLFRDARGEVLYVGKAKSLRPRVRELLPGGAATALDDRSSLPERVADIEVIVTGTEVEALHLEQNLVKRHRPPFNVRLRDDKSFPYIAVTVEDEYPRVMFTRERHRRGVVYFGPYANAKKVRETLDVLNRVFPYRPCEGPKPGRHSGIPCLDYHIDRCLAPCVGYVSKEDYRAIIDSVIEFLSGDVAADPARARAEDAARRPRASASRTRRATATASSRCGTSPSGRRPTGASVGTIDVIGFAVEGDRAAVQVFPLRDGKLIDRYALPPRERRAARTLRRCSRRSPRVLRLGAERAAADRRAARRGRHVRARGVPLASGAARASRCAPPSAARSGGCSELADENARLALESEAAADRAASGCGASRRSRSCARRSTSRACRSGSSASTSRTSRAESAVGSMVVFQDAHAEEGALPQVRRSRRRRRAGRLRRDGRGDLAPVRAPRRTATAARRLRRVVRGDAEPRRHRRRQGPALRGARRDAGVRPAARRGDLAREARSRRCSCPGSPTRSCSTAHSPGLQLLQRVRDEAHRFALGFHRQRRDARGSRVDLRRPRRASARRGGARCCSTSARPSGSSPRRQEELEGVPGVPRRRRAHLRAAAQGRPGVAA